MRQFFKFTFASMLGFFLAFVLVIIVFAGIIGGLVSNAEQKTETIEEGKHFIHLKFNYPINDRANDNPFEEMNFGKFSTSEKPGLFEILQSIKHAKKDEKVAGIFLDLNSLQAGMATIHEIRNALIDFKKSGKKIYSFADDYAQTAYYLASVSNKIFLHNMGAVQWKGVSTELLFFKNALEKLEVDPQVIRHGKFKSAVEPFTEEKMSAENRKQIRTFQTAFWETMKNDVAASRNISKEELERIANNYACRNAEDAIALKLVDKIVYRDEVYSEIAIVTGKKPEKSFIPLAKYFGTTKADDSNISSNKIAIIFASGEIEDGRGESDNIGGDRFAEIIKKAREDEKIKAVVIRVNSPGGSALASEIMWREIELTKKKKPIIVSMGDVAASGGYYISCNADKVYASPLTITGSIGVFGLMFNINRMLKNKLGLTVDTVKSNAMADIGTPLRMMTANEREIIQQGVDRIYNTFTSRVSAGRNIEQSQVDSIGQGRVWAGIDAKNIKLIDEFGGINDAIAFAAKKAGVKDYRIVQLPEKKDAFTALFESLNEDAETKMLHKTLGENFSYYKTLTNALKNKGIRTRMEYDLKIN